MACILTVTNQAFGIIIGATKLYILISVWITLTFCSRSQLYEKEQNLQCRFSQKFTVGLNEIYNVATTYCFVQAHAKFILYMQYSSLNDFDVHSRSQGHGKAKTCSIILLKSCMKLFKCSFFLNRRDGWLRIRDSSWAMLKDKCE